MIRLPAQLLANIRVKTSSRAFPAVGKYGCSARDYAMRVWPIRTDASAA